MHAFQPLERVLSNSLSMYQIDATKQFSSSNQLSSCDIISNLNIEKEEVLQQKASHILSLR